MRQKKIRRAKKKRSQRKTESEIAINTFNIVNLLNSFLFFFADDLALTHEVKRKRSAGEVEVKKNKRNLQKKSANGAAAVIKIKKGVGRRNQDEVM
jgi:hypothetical protein